MPDLTVSFINDGANGAGFGEAEIGARKIENGSEPLRPPANCAEVMGNKYRKRPIAAINKISDNFITHSQARFHCPAGGTALSEPVRKIRHIE